MIIIITSLSVPVNAEDLDPGLPPSGPEGLGDPDIEVPFDGGLSILLMSGAAYGAKKVVTYRKNIAAVRNKG